MDEIYGSSKKKKKTKKTAKNIGPKNYPQKYASNIQTTFFT